MKLILKLMLVALVLVGVSPFLLHGPDGRPLFSLDRLKLGKPIDAAGKSMKSIQSDIGKAAQQPADDTTTVHKWIDEHGVWHFSDRANPDGGDQVVRINTNTNVVRATPVAKEAAEEKAADGRGGKDGGQKDDSGTDIPFPTTVPMKDIPKLVNDTRALQQTMNKRYEEQQKLIESLQQ